MDVKLIGGTVAAIAVGTVVLCLVGGLLRRRWAGGAWAVLLALAVAPLAADKPLLGERPQWRASDPDHADAVQRIILAAAPLSLAAMALSARRVPWPVRGLLAAAAPVAIVYWVVTAYPGPPLADWPHRLAAPAVASLVLWLLIEPLNWRTVSSPRPTPTPPAAPLPYATGDTTAAAHPTGVAAPWVCGALAAGVGLLNLFSTATAPGWVAVAVGGVVGGAFLVALTPWAPSFAGGPVAVVTSLLACAVMAHRVGGGEVPTAAWLLLIAAPAAAWVVELRPMNSWRPWLREPLRMALVAVPVVVAVVPGYRRWQKEQAAETSGPGWSMVVPMPPGRQG